MIQHEVSTHLNLPVEQVFAFLIDANNLRAWQSNLIESEQLSEEPMRVGTHFREVRQLGRRPTEYQAEITEFEPNKRFATRTLSVPQASVSYTFNRENSGTRLDYKFVLQTSGLMRLLKPMIAASIKKETLSDFENLKRLLER
jgi:uncharacterized protein YndB with AHSA1/START domain